MFLHRSLLAVGDTGSTENRRATRQGGKVTSIPGDAFLIPVWFYDFTDAESVHRIKSLQNSPKFNTNHSRDAGDYDLSVKCSGWNTASVLPSHFACALLLVIGFVLTSVTEYSLSSKNISRLLIYHEQDRTITFHPSLEGGHMMSPEGPMG